MLSFMTDTAISPFMWWGARRFRYNVGLIVAGLLAFVAYVTVGVTLLPADADFDFSPFIVPQGVGYLVMMGVANICYFLGPLSEWMIHPADPERYRCICYQLGFWFSVLLPFSIPALLAVSAILHWI